MNIMPEKISLDDTIKTISGMLKYVHNNKNGEVDLEYLSAVSNLSLEFVQSVIELFVANEVLKIKFIEETFLKFEFLAPKEMQVIKEHSLFKDVQQTFDEMIDFRQRLFEIPLDEIYKLCSEEPELVEV